MGHIVPVSGAFHEAVQRGARQRALIYFFGDELYLTNDDLTAAGIQYENYFCPEREVAVGCTPSATISFSIFNEDHRLDSMQFGRFWAGVAAMLNEASHTVVGNVSINYNGYVLSGHAEYPYFRVNGTGTGDQPDFAIDGMLAANGYIYCLGVNGGVVVYGQEKEQDGTWQIVSELTWEQVMSHTWGDVLTLGFADDNFFIDGEVTVAQIMLPALLRYANRHVGIVVTGSRTFDEYLPTGFVQSYEYADVGYFWANRPERVRTNIIEVYGYDGMSRFDVLTDDMQVTFPITLKALLDLVCAYVGVSHKIGTFINEDIVVTESSNVFQSTTAREIVGYIAQAACANARIDYDGLLCFDWWQDVSLVISESEYVTFVSCEYQVAPIDKLQVRGTENDIGVIVGSGTNGYVIQDNPFLVFDSAEEGQTRAQPIYDRLAAFPAYIPGACQWFADWSYRPGIVVIIMQGDTAHRFPVFGYTMRWAGLAMAGLESTGSEERDVMDAEHREAFVAGRKMLEIKKDIDGVSITASEAKTTSEAAYNKATSAELTVDGLSVRVSSVETAQGTTSTKVSALEQTVDGISTRVSSVESGQEALSSQVSQNATNISTKVSKGSVVSEINQSAESVQISAQKINFNGAVITNGSLTTGNWTFDQNGSNYSGNGVGVSMNVLTGGGFVGGGSDIRAFYTSSNCDVQYGSDYNYQCVMRGGMIQMFTKTGTGVAIEHINGAEDPSLYCIGSGSTWDTAKGNLGGASHRWDVGYIRSFNQASSRHVKHDIEDMPDMGDVIDGLRPVTFAYNGDKTEQKQYGLIYEEAIDVFDYICLKPKTRDPNEIGIDYTRLISVLLQEVKSLRARVKALEERGG